MASITLTRKSTTYDKNLQCHRLKLVVSSATGITSSIFVKQRTKDPITKLTTDSTVAVASAFQLEDFGESSPLAGSSYFRASTADWISPNADYLEQVYNDVLNDIRRLLNEAEAMNMLATDDDVVITAEEIEPPESDDPDDDDDLSEDPGFDQIILGSQIFG